MRRIAALALTLSLFAAGVATAGPASAQDRATTVAVTGAVATPASYTRDQLAGLGQVTLPDTRSGSAPGGSLTGVLLEDLVQSSAPILPVTKNAQLGVTITVSGVHGRAVSVALGELDPAFGNHPALLVLAYDGHPLSQPSLAFPGDRGFARTVTDVRGITVAVVHATVPTAQPAGSVEVLDGRHTAILSAAQLSRLPAHTLTVGFLAGTSSQTHTETGPLLADVLRAAGIRTTPTTSVAAVGSDGYLAAVTPAEATSGRRPLLISTVEDGVALGQPRLVTDGDVKGGRYVSGVVELVVTSVGR